MILALASSVGYVACLMEAWIRIVKLGTIEYARAFKILLLISSSDEAFDFNKNMVISNSYAVIGFTYNEKQGSVVFNSSGGGEVFFSNLCAICAKKLLKLLAIVTESVCFSPSSAMISPTAPLCVFIPFNKLITKFCHIVTSLRAPDFSTYCIS